MHRDINHIDVLDNLVEDTGLRDQIASRKKLRCWLKPVSQAANGRRSWKMNSRQTGS